jgi:hypothetical protein
LIWSAVTGPYSFRSAPMILYMAELFDLVPVHSLLGHRSIRRKFIVRKESVHYTRR